MTCEPATLLGQLLAVPVATADASSLREGCRTLARLRGVLDAIEASMVARLAALHHAGVAAAPGDVLIKAGNVSGRDAKRAVARSEVIGAVPDLAPALTQGKVSAGHADVLARVAGRLDDATRDAFLAEGPLLVGAAGRLTPESFERHCKRVADSLGDGGLGEFERQRRQTQLRHWIDRTSGMYVIHAELDPEIGTAVFSAIDAEVERMFHSDATGAGAGIVDELARNNEHLAAHALASLVHRGHASSFEGPVTAEVSVLIDGETLMHGLHEHSVCELADGTPIPVATARRMACEAALLPIVLGGDGVPIDVGRRRRLATRAQRAALRSMYRTCAFDGCDVPHSRCQPHHLREWEARGPTDLANLIPLCHRHHHLVHEGGWTLELAPDRTLTIGRPDGGVHAIAPLRSPIERAA